MNLNQIDMVLAIMKEIERQQPGVKLSAIKGEAIIKAANIVVDEHKKEAVGQFSNGGSTKPGGKGCLIRPVMGCITLWGSSLTGYRMMGISRAIVSPVPTSPNAHARRIKKAPGAGWGGPGAFSAYYRSNMPFYYTPKYIFSKSASNTFLDSLPTHPMLLGTPATENLTES